jgi:hypothetical protein
LDTTKEDFDDADEDDAFGVEEGDICIYTNSTFIIYLRLWLNKRPGLIRFVSRQIPSVMQLDSMADATGVAMGKKSEEKSIQRRSPDLLAGAIKELAESSKHPAEAVDTEITASISKMPKFSSRKDEIDSIKKTNRLF